MEGSEDLMKAAKEVAEVFTNALTYYQKCHIAFNGNVITDTKIVKLGKP